MHVTNDGEYHGDGVTLTSSHYDMHTVLVEDGGVAFLDGTTHTTTTTYIYGLEVKAGGSIYADGIVITTDGYASDAISMDGAGAYVSLDGATITVDGQSARGIRLQNGAVVEGADVSILSRYLGSGDGAPSVVISVESGSSVTLTDSDITAEGLNSSGVEIFESTFVGTRVAIKAIGSGASANGVFVASSDGQLILKDSSVSSRADLAHAIYAYDLANVTLDNARVTASGDGAHGFFLYEGGVLLAKDSRISATGDGAAAISVYSTTSAVGDISITGGGLSSSSGPLILSEGGTSTITLKGPMTLSPGTVAGSAVLASITNSADITSDLDLVLNGVYGATGRIEVTGTGNTLDVVLTDSRWTGDLEVATDNSANVSLTGSTWTGKATNASDIDLDANSVWSVTGDSDAVFVDNAGRISFIPRAGAFSTLTAQDYVGKDGTLVVNTFLESDGSDSDRLVIDGGGATGSTGIIVKNAGGGGALTLADGILVVDAVDGATTGTDAFHLAERAAAGAYEYLLFRGGESDEQDWFLRSYIIEEPPVQVPLYRPESPLYSPVPAMARQMGMAFLGTLHERVGEQMNIAPQPREDDRYEGVWGRLIGEHGSNDWQSSLDVSASSTSLAGAQGGIDLFRSEEDGRRDIAGIYAAYAVQSAAIVGHALAQDDLSVGNLTLGGPAAGAYWTHYTPEGGYVDAVVQANAFTVDGTSAYDARLFTSGYGFAASIEAGHPIAVTKGWQIEPQAQLIYQAVSIFDGADEYSTVSFEEGDALTGRLGVRVQFTSEDEETMFQPYAKANLWHGLGGTDRVTLGTSPSLETQYGDTALELGAGFTARVSDTASLYGHVDHRWSLTGAETRAATQAALGVRVNW